MGAEQVVVAGGCVFACILDGAATAHALTVAAPGAGSGAVLNQHTISKGVAAAERCWLVLVTGAASRRGGRAGVDRDDGPASDLAGARVGGCEHLVSSGDQGEATGEGVHAAVVGRES